MNLFSKPILKVLFPATILLLTLMFAANTLALASSEAAETKPEQDTGPYHVILETQTEPIVANVPTTIELIVTNKADGKAVISAKIISQATMDNSSTGMESSDMVAADGMDKPIETVLKETAPNEPGSYIADVNFKQPGHWRQTISIRSSLGQSTVDFPVTVMDSGPNFIFIGVVAGLIVIAGIIAAIIKKQEYAKTGGAI